MDEGFFARVGSTKQIKSDVRIISATNVDLHKKIKEGLFREDLYYRLNAIEIKVPALRERKEDIPLIFRKFVVDFAEKYRMPAIRLTDEATEMLKTYYWQGNVRQLKNVAQQISLIEKHRDITPAILMHYLPANQMQRSLAIVERKTQREIPMEDLKMLYNMVGMLKREIDILKNQISNIQSSYTTHSKIDDEIVEWEQEQIAAPTDATFISEGEIAEQVDEKKELKLTDMEKETIRQALTKNNGNRKVTAQALGLSERTLYRKIKEYNL